MMFDFGTPDIDTLLFTEMEAVFNRGSKYDCQGNNRTVTKAGEPAERNKDYERKN